LRVHNLKEEKLTEVVVVFIEEEDEEVHVDR
jgi:hypothetical protein